MQRERKVGLPAAMQVSDLMTINAKLDSAKAMRLFDHVRPTRHLMLYQLSNAAHDALLTVERPLFTISVCRYLPMRTISVSNVFHLFVERACRKGDEVKEYKTFSP